MARMGRSGDPMVRKMGNRRQGQYPMTKGIRRDMMPNTPQAPNGRPNGQVDAEPRNRRSRNEIGMLNDPMKGSLNARADAVMARNPGFNRENVMARIAGRRGLDTGQEGFDPNRLRQPDERAALREQRQELPPYVKPEMLHGEGGTGAGTGSGQEAGSAQLPGFERRREQYPMQIVESRYDPRAGMTGQIDPMAMAPQSYPNAAYPNAPQGYQSNVRRRPNAEWYKGGGRY